MLRNLFFLDGLVYCLDIMLQPLLCMLLILSWLVFCVVHWGCNARNLFPWRPFFSLFLLQIASPISLLSILTKATPISFFLKSFYELALPCCFYEIWLIFHNVTASVALL